MQMQFAKDDVFTLTVNVLENTLALISYSRNSRWL